jgi:adenylate kinase family enzyme
MARIVLLGCAGSGKSTLARVLAVRLQVPAIILDDIWQRDWGDADVPAFRETLRCLHEAGAWISDGNFAAATFDIRLPPATLIVWLDRPRWQCAWRAIARAFAPGSDHTLKRLPKVLAFIRLFDRINRPRIEALRKTHGPDVPVRHLTNDAEIAAFVAELMAPA